MSRTKLKAKLPKTVTGRGTLFRGLLDCYTLNGPGHPCIVVHGRVATLAQRSVVDILFARTQPFYFLHDGKKLEGRGDHEICDAVLDLFRGDADLTPEQSKVVSGIVKEIIQTITGSAKARDLVNGIFGEELFK